MTLYPTPAPAHRSLITPTKGHVFAPLAKGAIADNGTITGYAAVFGNVDDGGDVIQRGFFAPVLKDFLREGFMAAGHDWTKPCGVPLQAREDSAGLLVTAAFHSDAESQRYRAIASERLAAGKTVGLSIGYEVAPGGATYRDDGARLLTKASRLFEFSIVTVPMNREAIASDVKAAGRRQLDVDAVSDAALAASDFAEEQRLIRAEAKTQQLPPIAATSGNRRSFLPLAISSVPRGTVEKLGRVLDSALRDRAVSIDGEVEVRFYLPVAVSGLKGAFEHSVTPGRALDGFVRAGEPRVINLDASRPVEQMCHTLLHELGHVEGFLTGSPSKGFDESRADTFATRLSTRGHTYA